MTELLTALPGGGVRGPSEQERSEGRSWVLSGPWLPRGLRAIPTLPPS